MKYTRTALGLLTRQYRSVLKKCWLINVGLFALGAAGVMVPNEAEAATGCSALNATSSSLQDVINCLKASQLAVGYDNTATGDYSTALGHKTSATGDNSLAIGYRVKAVKKGDIAIGDSGTEASGEWSIAIGSDAKSTGDLSIAIGEEARAIGDQSILIGGGAWRSASGDHSIVFGKRGRASADYATTFGSFAYASAKYAMALGNAENDDHATQASGLKSVALGYHAVASSENAVVIGTDSTDGGADTISVGNSTTQRKIVNVAAGTADNDAVNFKQMTDAIAAAGGGSYTEGTGIDISTVDDEEVISLDTTYMNNNYYTKYGLGGKISAANDNATITTIAA